MGNLYIEKLKTRIYQDARSVNVYAEIKDINRNHTNYGCVTAIASVLADFGYIVNIPVWEDNGYLRIPFIEVDKQRVDLENGKQKNDARKYFAVHMRNIKTGEEQIQKVSAIDVDHAHSERFFFGSEWVWTGSGPWHNMEGKVEMISKGFYRKKA